MKRVLIVGVSGQDGTLLAQLLKTRGIDYIGLNRQGLVGPDGKVIRPGSLADPDFINDLVRSQAPTQVYYLSAHHHSSQEIGAADDLSLWRESLQVQVTGLTTVLEALRLHSPSAKLFYASSSRIFGTSAAAPQTEATPRLPDTIYGITKMTGMEICRYYSQARGQFASTGILYNHESMHRQDKFLSKKIILAAHAIKKGLSRQLVLGDLSSRVDWGYAPDYVEAMTRILDLTEPGEYIIATGETHSVREFVQLAFAEQGLDYREWVKEDSSLVRPNAACLVGDAGKLRRETGWSPSLSFAEMVARLTAEICQHAPPNE